MCVHDFCRNKITNICSAPKLLAVPVEKKIVNFKIKLIFF